MTNNNNPTMQHSSSVVSSVKVRSIVIVTNSTFKFNYEKEGIVYHASDHAIDGTSGISTSIPLSQCSDHVRNIATKVEAGELPAYAPYPLQAGGKVDNSGTPVLPETQNSPNAIVVTSIAIFSGGTFKVNYTKQDEHGNAVRYEISKHACKYTSPIDECSQHIKEIVEQIENGELPVSIAYPIAEKKENEPSPSIVVDSVVFLQAGRFRVNYCTTDTEGNTDTFETEHDHPPKEGKSYNPTAPKYAILSPLQECSPYVRYICNEIEKGTMPPDQTYYSKEAEHYKNIEIVEANE